MRIFRWSALVTLVGIGGAYWYAGGTGLVIALVLIVMEVSLSFDNAVVNAAVLARMSEFWQRFFLTFGILIAVFGMRLLFPFVVVGVTAHLSPAQALSLALEKGDPEVPGTYGFLLHEAHPAIAAFGGMFLLMLFLTFLTQEREHSWVRWVERPSARLGALAELPTVVGLVVLTGVSMTLGDDHAGTVLVAGIAGVATFLVVTGLGDAFAHTAELTDAGPADADGSTGPSSAARTGSAAVVVGRSAFFLFLYLEVLDASFSFDGVIGAFAITSDPIVIAIGLGVGAMWIRSLTVYLVRQGTLAEYVYLEHGAHWAIGALAVILLVTIQHPVPEVVTGLVGVAFIGAGFLSSLAHNRRAPARVLVP